MITRPHHARLPYIHLCGFLFGLCLHLFSPSVEARDIRLAVLIGNQHGWQGEPELKYVFTGDIQPMAKQLRRIGFTVFTVLKNRDAKAIRQQFRKIIQVIKTAKVTTFYLYYSGHADKTYLHTGPKEARPLSYKELAAFLGKIQTKRRFLVLDACFSGEIIKHYGSLNKYKHLLRKGKIPKGRYASGRDLRKYFPLNGQDVRGLQILSSSRNLSYQDTQKKASVFTYHFLKGMQGKADFNKDGKVSIGELFLYVKPKVEMETGQAPQRLNFTVGGGSYGFAPLYQSRVLLGTSLLGLITISVDGFVWRKEKKQAKQFLLKVKSGHGKIHVQQKKACWTREIQLRKGKTFSLVNLKSTSWTKTTCRKVAIGKGDVFVPIQLDDKVEESELSLLLSISGGVSDLGTGEFQAKHPFLGIGFRIKSFTRGYGGITLAYFLGRPSERGTSKTILHRFSFFDGEIGIYLFRHSLIEPFVGCYLQIGGLLPVHTNGKSEFAFFMGGGVRGGLDILLLGGFGLRLEGSLGGEFTGFKEKGFASASWKLALSALFRL